MNKLSSHVGLAAPAGDALDTKTNFSRVHLLKLLHNHQHDDEEFALANDILKSVGNEKKTERRDTLHRCIQVVRYIAEVLIE